MDPHEAPRPGYWDRVKSMLDVCGPPSWRFLFTSASEVARAKDILAWSDSQRRQRRALRAETTAPAPSSDAPSSGSTYSEDEVQWARRVEAAILHPDTREPILWPFRMSAHVPCNTVLLMGMLTARSVAWTAFWQFANQTFNAAQFFANRNATNEVSNERLAASYVGAVGSAVAVATVLRRWELQATRPWVGRVGLFIPFIAAGAAKPLQIGLMRSDEVTAGVAVFDPHTGERVSDAGADDRSVVAGRAAVGTTVFTRILYLAQPMILPPLLMAALRRHPRWGSPAFRTARTVTEVAVVATMSAIATPLCIALFDQNMSLPVTELEPPMQAVVRRYEERTGRTLPAVTFNKGL